MRRQSLALAQGRSMMLLSIPANPVPSDLYRFFRGGSSKIGLPWYVWGGGMFDTKVRLRYEQNTSVNLVRYPCPSKPVMCVCNSQQFSPDRCS